TELWLAGDLHLGEKPTAALLSPLLPLTEGAIGIVNLEGAVADAPHSPAPDALHPRLLNPASSLDLLAPAGIRIVSTANNHATDGGSHAQTIAALQAVGVQAAGPLGVGRYKRVTLSAWDLEAGLPVDLEAQLRSLRSQTEVLVVAFHTSGPPSYLPDPALSAAVQTALTAEAQVVVAHGSHLVGPVERRGNSVVAWGLGNLAMACDCTQEKDSMILRVRLEGPRLIDAEVLPIEAGLRGASPRPSPAPNAIFDLLEAIGSPMLERHGNHAVLPPGR
ncbi:MAG TPA: CapA family protein, partial [Myxococcota bacterium]|nr:CapA family protein [Myxococcota bacterium]